MAQRILIVDDDPALRRTMTRVLESAGYEVEAVGSGEWGFDELVKHGCEFAAAVVDWSLPGMTGQRFAELAGKICPELPILHVSGYRPELPAGARRLDKPFGPLDLIAAVRMLTGIEQPEFEVPDDEEGEPTSPETPEAKQ